MTSPISYYAWPLGIGVGTALRVVSASLFVLLLVTGRAAADLSISPIDPNAPGAGGVTTDAFDVHQGTTVIANSAMSSGFMGSGPSVPQAALGGTSSFYEPTNTIFADTPPSTGYDFIEFKLVAPITLSYFNLYLAEDNSSGFRGTSSFSLLVSSDGTNFTSVTGGFVSLNPDYVDTYGSVEIIVSDVLVRRNGTGPLLVVWGE